MATQTKQELKYNRDRRFEATPKAYDEVYAFLRMLAHHPSFSDNGAILFFDEAETKAARLNGQKRIIELSSRVNPDMVGSVKHIIRTEIRGDDVSPSR